RRDWDCRNGLVICDGIITAAFPNVSPTPPHPQHHPHAELVPDEPGFRYSQTPRRVYWELTIACGLACQHCRAGAIKERLPQELSTEEVFTVLRSLARGEPK